MVPQRRTAATVVVALLAACTLAACGSSSSSSSSSSASSSSSTAGTTNSAASAKATGPAVDVWTIAPVGAPNQTAPQLPAGVKAAFRYINNQGGIGPDHQPVTVKFCNTQGTPPGELQCAQQAASDPKAIAAVQPLIVINTAGATAAFQKAGLPSINPFVQSPPDFVAPINFPLFAPNFAGAGCAVMAPPVVHATKIGFAALTLPISIAEMNAAIAAAKKAGFTVVGHVEVPLTTTNISPYVRQLQQNHPQFTVLLFTPELVSAWLAAAAQIGASGPTCMQDGLVSYQVLAGLGSNAANVYAASFLPDPAWTGYPLLDQFRTQASAEAAAGDSSASLAPGNDPLLVLQGWVASQVVPQVAATMKGPITRAKFLQAINQAKVTFGSNEAVLPPIDFAKPNPEPQYARLFNTTMFLKKWDVATKSWVRVTSVPPVHGDQLVP